MLRRLAVPAFLCLIVIAFFWKLTLTRQYTCLASPDMAQEVLPWLQFQAREWHQFHLPLWDPYSWAGQPLLAQGQPGAAYPFNWILFLVPFSHGWMSFTALNWYYVLTRVLAALTFYWLARDLGRSRWACLLAAATYGVAGYLGTVVRPQMVNGAVWVPLVFLFQLRSARGERPMRNAILSGFFLGVTWLCGHHQMPLFVTLGSGFLWLYLCARTGRLRVLAAMGMTVLVSAVQTLPTAEYGRLAVRWLSGGDPVHWNQIAPYPLHGQHSMPPLSLWSIVIPEIDFSVSPIVGIAAFALALIGLVKCWSDLRVRCLAAVALGGLLFSMGPASLLHGVLFAVMPMVEKARVPAQSLILFHVGVCALLAFGVDALPSLSRKAAGWIAAALLAFGGVLAFGGLYLFFAKVLSVTGDTRFMMTALSAVLTAGLLLALTRGAIPRRVGAALFLGLMLLEVANVSTYFFAHVDDAQRMADLRRMTSEDADIRLFLTQRDKPRVSVDMEALPHNLGHWWGMEVFDAYLASAPALLWDNEPFSPRTRSLLGIRYFIGTKPLMPDQTQVFEGKSGRKVYEFPAAMPRVWSVHRVERVKTEQVKQMLTNGSVDFREGTFTTLASPPLETCAGTDDVRMTEHDVDNVSVEASMACRGMVVLNDQFFPGWKATVDGKPVPILDAYGLVRGVVVDAGKHEIEFEYLPWTVFAGLAMSLTGGAIALVAAVKRA